MSGGRQGAAQVGAETVQLVPASGSSSSGSPTVLTIPSIKGSRTSRSGGSKSPATTSSVIHKDGDVVVSNESADMDFD